LGVGAETAAIADLSLGANGAAGEARGKEERSLRGKAEDKFNTTGESRGMNSKRESPGEKRRERGGGRKKKRDVEVEF
jgi:hypothetical protein